MPKIKAILLCLNSKRDINGNRYWAFQYTDTETGKRAAGTVTGGRSNISMLPEKMGLKWDEVYFYGEEVGKRDFRGFTFYWPHAGSHPEALADFTKKQLAA